MRDHWDRWGWLAATIIIACVLTFAVLGRETVCGPSSEQCVREWVAALGGWAAVAAAIPTVLFLQKQISDADRHKRAEFSIQLRRQRILAESVRQKAYESLLLLDMISKDKPSVMSWDNQITYRLVAKLREDENIKAFEREIAHPKIMSAKVTGDFLYRSMSGEAGDGDVAPEVVRDFFNNLAKQAEDFLAEVKKKTGDQ